LPCCLQLQRQLEEQERLAQEEARKLMLEEQARKKSERLRQLQDEWRTAATMQQARGRLSSGAPGSLQPKVALGGRQVQLC